MNDLDYWHSAICGYSNAPEGKVELPTYIYPPRTSSCLPRSALHIFDAPGYIGQLKFNDTHIMLDYQGKDLVTIWDRHGGHPKHGWEREHQDLMLLGERLLELWGPGRHLLDGGLLHYKHAAVKNTIVVWDVLVQNDVHLLGTTYGSRWDLVRGLAPVGSVPYVMEGATVGIGLVGSRVFMPGFCFPQGWGELWDVVEGVNVRFAEPLLEGIVVKSLTSKLGHGLVMKNNASLMHRCRVTTGRHRF